MNEIIETQQEQAITSSKKFNKSLMDLSEILNLEVDITTLGLNFEELNYIEYEDGDGDEYLGIQFVHSFSNVLDMILISSLDLNLLNENISEIFEEYEISIEIEKSKVIGKSVKQYQLIINIFKDKNLWEETYYV